MFRPAFDTNYSNSSDLQMYFHSQVLINPHAHMFSTYMCEIRQLFGSASLVYKRFACLSCVMFQSPRVIRSCCRSARNRLQAFLGTSNVCKNPARSLHSANRRSSAVELSNSHHRFHRSVDPTLRRLHHTNTMTDNANTSGAESQQQRTYEVSATSRDLQNHSFTRFRNSKPSTNSTA